MNESYQWRPKDTVHSALDVAREIIVPTTQSLLDKLREQPDEEAKERLRRELAKSTNIIQGEVA